MSKAKTILILEDNQERIAEFTKVVGQLGESLGIKVWQDANSMMRECEAYFANAVLISLDHDLSPGPGVTADPGTGLEVAQFLADFLPVCPVLLHSSNTDRVYSMHNELRFSKWIVDRVGPLGTDWIASSWSRKVRELVAAHGNTWTAELPPDHAERVSRMLLSLDGLSIGDSLGEMLAYRAEAAPAYLTSDGLPAGPWFHTDDTEMAISIAAILKSHGKVEQDGLAKRFVRRWEREPDRGYGRMTRIQMQEILRGRSWRETSAAAFGGSGSMGNGAAMRVAPLGGYFAGDRDQVAEQARDSAMVTHMHPEGIAGAVATAVAACAAWQARGVDPIQRPNFLLQEVLRLTPESEVRRKILLATHIPPDTGAEAAAKVLGRGDLVTAPDTVPFCLWTASHHLNNYVEALAETIRVGGDCDTNAAIVGGIVALSAGRESIPAGWMRSREPFVV